MHNHQLQEQIGVTKDDIEVHVQKSAHVQKMHEQMENESIVESQRKEIPETVAVAVSAIQVKWNATTGENGSITETAHEIGCCLWCQ